jgi:hypothetical protein
VGIFENVTRLTGSRPTDTQVAGMTEADSLEVVIIRRSPYALARYYDSEAPIGFRSRNELLS